MSNELVQFRAEKHAGDCGVDDWFLHKAAIRDLYLAQDMTLAQVRQHMLKHYKFQRSAQQYQRILKKWNFTKNLSKAHYQEMKDNLKRKRLDAGDASITIGNRFLSNKKLKREIERRFATTLADKWLARPSLPLKHASVFDESITNVADKSIAMTIRPALNKKFVVRPVKSTPWIQFATDLDKRLVGLLRFRDRRPTGYLSQLNSLSEAVNVAVSSPLSGLESVRSAASWHVSPSTSSSFSRSASPRALGGVSKASTDPDVTALTRVHPKIEAMVMDPFESVTSHSTTNADGQLVDGSGPDYMAILYLMANNFRPMSLRSDSPNRTRQQLWEAVSHLLTKNSFFTTKAISYQLLAICCRNLDKDLLQKLISARVNINSVISNAQKGAMTILQYTLIVHDYQNDCWDTRLSSFVSILLDAGADPNKCGCGLGSGESCGFGCHQAHDVTCSPDHRCCANMPFGILINNDLRINPHAGNVLDFKFPQLDAAVAVLLLQKGARICENISITRLVEWKIPVVYLQKHLSGLTQINELPTAGRYFWSPVQAALADFDVDLAKLLHTNGEWQHNMPGSLQHCKSDQRIWRWHEPPGGMRQWRLPLTLAFDLSEGSAISLLQIGMQVNGCYLDGTSHKLIPDSRATSQVEDDMSKWMLLMNREIGYSHMDWSYRTHKTLHLTALQAAVVSGSLRGVRLLLRAGASLQCCHGTPPLVLAVIWRQHDIVQLLLASGADPNDDKLPCDTRLWHLCPLAEAAARGCILTMTTLLTAGADINKCDSLTGFTALQAAIICDQHDSIEFFLKYEDLDVSHPGSRMGVDAFTLATLKGDFDLFQKLLYRVGSLMSLPSRVKERLRVAAARSSVNEICDLVRGLDVELSVSSIVRGLQYGVPYSTLLGPEVDLDRKVGHCSVADVLFAYAIENCKTELAFHILQREVEISEEMSESLLRHVFALFNDPNNEIKSEKRYDLLKLILMSRNWSIWLDGQLILTQLLERGFSLSTFRLVLDAMLRYGINMTELGHFGGRSPVSFAVKSRWESLTKSLLDYGFSPNGLPNQRFVDHDLAPLQRALTNGDIGIARLLLSYGADVNAAPQVQIDTGNNGGDERLECRPMTTALEISCGARVATDYNVWSLHGSYQPNVTTVKMLLSAGADPNLGLLLGRESILTIAARWGDVDIVSELIAAGAFINEPAPVQEFAQTPLQAASACGNLDVVVMLVNYGANVNMAAGPNRGVTALQAAAIGGYFRIVQILLGAGADVASPASPVEGRTAIDGAAEHGRLDIVKFLLDEYKGHEPLLGVCKTAARFARKEGHMAVFELLTTYRRFDDGPPPESEAAVNEDQSTRYVEELNA